MSQVRIRDYAEYQAANFRAALRDETKKHQEKSKAKVKNATKPKVPVQMGVFEIRDNQFQLNMAEIQKLPLFMKFYSGIKGWISFLLLIFRHYFDF